MFRLPNKSNECHYTSHVGAESAGGVSPSPITITLSGGPSLHEFLSFSAKLVRGFDPARKDGLCLRGPFVRVHGARTLPMNSPTPYVLPAEAACLYVYGRSSHGAGEDVYAPLIPVQGERVVVPLTVATDEKRRDVQRLARLLLEQEWIFARTMPENPHCYSPRKTWVRDEDFVFAVETIRRLGYRQKYGTYWETVFAVGAHFYWTGWMPVASTFWMNRKPLASPVHAEALVDQIFIAENARLLDIPELPDGFAGLDATITRSRHFQAGVHLFGYVAPDTEPRPRLRKRDGEALGSRASAWIEQKGVLKRTENR
jgi:hypothetical protein